MDDSIEPKQVHIRAPFKVVTAKENGCYSVVSKATHYYMKDPEKIAEEWEKRQQQLLQEIAKVDDIKHVPASNLKEVKERLEFERKDFLYLDAQRFSIDNSFGMIVETIGPYTNKEIVSKACIVLQNIFYDFIKELESDSIPIEKSGYTKSNPSIMDNSYDVILEEKDSTFGKVLEYILYSKHFHYKEEKNEGLAYISFGKFHPHHSYSILRMAFYKDVTKEEIKNLLVESATLSSNIFTSIYSFFK